MMILGYQQIDPKLYESKYIHDFKIIGHIKKYLSIMDELKELNLKGESVKFLYKYNIYKNEYSIIK